MTQPTTLELADTLRALRKNLQSAAEGVRRGHVSPFVLVTAECMRRYGPLKMDGSLDDRLASAMSNLWHHYENQAAKLEAGVPAVYAEAADQILATFDAIHAPAPVPTSAVEVLRRVYEMLERNANVVTENEQPSAVDALLREAAKVFGQIDAGAALQPDLVAELRALPRSAGGVDAAAMEAVLIRFEADRAKGLASLESTDRDECVIRLANGRAIHVPAAPAECDYVRIVERGEETAYWNSDEWQEAPAEVMGALMGAAKGRALEASPQD